MDTVLCLDTSGSMSGNRIQELKRAVEVFIGNAAKSGLGERVAVVEFGKQTKVRHSLSNNYSSLSRSAAGLSTGGTTPMAEGLVHVLNEISKNGKITVVANRIRLNPRVILMTDGQPDSEAKVKQAAAAFATLGIPIACVGVKGCDQSLLKWIASSTGGMFTMADKITELSTFFLRQVLLTLFIVRFAEDLDKLYSIEALRYFMEERTGRRLSDAELRALLALIRTIASAEQKAATGPSSRTSIAKSKTSRRAKTGNILFAFCLLLNSIASPYIVLRCWQAHTEAIDWLSGGIMGGLGWQGKGIIWVILGLAVVTYLVSRWVYNGTFIKAFAVFSFVFLLLFGWFSWPACLGYAALGAVGLIRRVR